MGTRTRVKICGITRVDDAREAERLGADAIGFVFWSGSARFIEPAAAARIVAEISAFVTPVGLFLDASPAWVEAALEALPNLLPQFHGRESVEDCTRYGRPYIKAIGMGEGPDAVAREIAGHEAAVGLLFDSHVPGQTGGTGTRFDWRRLEAMEPRRLVLAGGLNADNVGHAIASVGPGAIDVSSGVERARGVKDARRMHDFMAAVRRADERRDNNGSESTQ